jgi:hypothetical protein
MYVVDAASASKNCDIDWETAVTKQGNTTYNMALTIITVQAHSGYMNAHNLADCAEFHMRSGQSAGRSIISLKKGIALILSSALYVSILVV